MKLSKQILTLILGTYISLFSQTINKEDILKKINQNIDLKNSKLEILIKKNDYEKKFREEYYPYLTLNGRTFYNLGNEEINSSFSASTNFKLLDSSRKPTIDNYTNRIEKEKINYLIKKVDIERNALILYYKILGLDEQIRTFQDYSKDIENLEHIFGKQDIFNSKKTGTLSRINALKFSRLNFIDQLSLYLNEDLSKYNFKDELKKPDVELNNNIENYLEDCTNEALKIYRYIYNIDINTIDNNLNIAKSKMMPNVVLSGGYSKYFARDLQGAEVSISISYNLFDFGRDYVIQNAEIRKKQSDNMLNKKYYEIKQMVRDNFFQMMTHISLADSNYMNQMKKIYIKSRETKDTDFIIRKMDDYYSQRIRVIQNLVSANEQLVRFKNTFRDINIKLKEIPEYAYQKFITYLSRIK